MGTHASLDLGAEGRPHISRHDSSNESLKYAHWTGSAWISQTVDSHGYVGEDTSLVVDSSGRPHISHRDSFCGCLKYASWTGSAWTIQVVDSGRDVGYYTSLALDLSGQPHITYYDGGGLGYARRLSPQLYLPFLVRPADRG